jgi:hypothetical protein
MPRIKMTDNDCAMVFKAKTAEVEVIMPKREGSDVMPDHVVLMLAILEKLGTQPEFRDDVTREFYLKHGTAGQA